MATQQLNLKWSNHNSDMMASISALLEKVEMTDVTISCEGQFLKAHKIVLGACSPYFREIFDRHHSTPHPVIILSGNGFNFANVRDLICFMYTGEVIVKVRNQEELDRFLEAADTLQIKELPKLKGFTLDSLNHRAGGPIVKSELDLDTDSKPNPKEMENLVDHFESSFDSTRKRKLSKPATRTPETSSSSSSCSSSFDEDTRDGFPTPTTSPSMAKLQNHDEWFRSRHEGSNSWESLMLGSNSASNGDNLTNLASKPAVPEKIRRPQNAFMIFANEWRRKLALEHPEEENKAISVRLGNIWKNFDKKTKGKYADAAKQASADHKRKYPEYVYSPKEARLRKSLKKQQQQMAKGQFIPHNYMEVCFSDEDGRVDAGRADGGRSGRAGPPPSNPRIVDYYKDQKRHVGK